METKESVEVTVVDMPMELSVFDPLDVQIAEAKAKNESLAFDYRDKQGNKEARSWVATLRKLKAPVTEMHKTGKAAALKYCKEWDKAKNKRIGAIEGMVEYHDKPLREIKDAEAKKKADEDAKIKAEEERMEAERQAEIEAREKAVREREEKVQAEKEKLDQAERERQVADNAKKKAKEDADYALVAAENRRFADIQREKNKAKAEAEEKEHQVMEEQRLEREKNAEEEFEETERINDKNHRLAIHKDIYEYLACITDDETAKRFFHALHDNKVPHVTINY